MAKRGFLDGYKTYDPTTEGYGKPRQWRGEFRAAMGFEEAEEIINESKTKGVTPLGILGLIGRPTWNQIKSAYRQKAREFHPDVNKSPDATEMMKKINAAYVVLERQYGK